jgi:hypothetical protein
MAGKRLTCFDALLLTLEDIENTSSIQDNQHN